MTVRDLFLMSLQLSSASTTTSLRTLWHALRRHVRQPENVFASLNILHEANPRLVPELLMEIGFVEVAAQDDFGNIATLFLCLAWYGENLSTTPTGVAAWQRLRSDVRLYYYTKPETELSEVHLGTAAIAQASTIVREAVGLHIILPSQYDQTQEHPAVDSSTQGIRQSA